MTTEKHKEIEKVTKKLAPEQIKKNLLKASLFLAAFELLKHDIVKKVKDFYISGFDTKGFTYSPEYSTEVRSKDKDVLKASCKWLVEAGALEAENLDDILLIRKHRNHIAHELPKFLVDPEFSVKEKLLKKANEYMESVGKFWGRIEVDVDPEFDNVEVEYDGIRSLTSMFMSYIIEICGEN